GAPVLERLGLPATVFVVSGYCGRTNRWPGQSRAAPELEMMNWTELREIAARGVELGAHTVNHANLARIPPDQVASELRDCKRAIEDQVGKPVRYFAYPYGVSTRAVRRSVGQEFELACGTTLRFLGPQADPLDLPRIDAYYTRRPPRFETLMTPKGEQYIAARRFFRRIRACLFR